MCCLLFAVLAILLTFCWEGEAPTEPKCRVDAVFYRPDRGTPFQWFESAKEIQAFHAEHYRAAGTVEIYLQNRSEKSTAVSRLIVNGQDVTNPQKGGDVVWWRLHPNPLPPKSFGELLVRLRNAPQKPIAIEVQFNDGETFQLTVPITPPSVRIEGLGFDSEGKVYAFLEFVGKPNAKPTKVNKVWLDGEDVTRRTRIFAPNFWQNLCPLVIQPTKPLRFGSFHYLRVDTTDGIAATVFRARDDFFPLGSYGYVTPKEYALNDCNLHVSFGSLNKNQLDALGRYGLKGVSPLSKKNETGHPALWAYYLMDEPDVHDYSVKELPHEKRVGAFAMEMVERDLECYRRNPSALTFLTVNLTYKPANWFIYGRIADVLNTDPYALLVGWQMRQVFEVAETARLACVPNMMTITYQAMWIEPVKKPSEAKFPRMPFPEEVRIMMHYALAGGAKGLIAYIHCTERYPEQIFWGAQDYPDVWAEIGKVHREVELVSPVLARSHPLDIAKSLTDGLFVRPLVAPDAVLVVCVNEKGQSLPDRFVKQTIAPAELELSIPIWLPLKFAFKVGEGEFKPLPCKVIGDKLRVILPEIETAFLLLLCADNNLPKSLKRRYEQLRLSRAENFLRAMQVEERERGEQGNLLRKIPLLFERFAVSSQAEGCYGIERKTMWNPMKEQHNAWEWYDPEGKSEHKVFWTVQIERAGEYLVYACAHFFGHDLLLRVVDEKGQVVQERLVSADAEKVHSWTLPFSREGKYRLILMPKEGKGGSARIGKTLFVVPKEVAIEAGLER